MPLADRIVLRSSPTEDTTPDMGMLLGHALAMDYKRIVVARDQMRSSSMMKEALVAGILSSGADVLDIGVASGPAAALAATKGDCAVYVTEYRGYGMISGYILLNRDGSLFRKEQIRHLEKIFVDPPELPPSGKLGHVIDLLGAVDEYNSRLTSAVSGKSECAIILDCGCGPVSASAPVVLNEMGADVLTLNAQYDLDFKSEAMDETGVDITDTERLVGCNMGSIGICMNKIGTMMALLDEKGNRLTPEQLFATIVMYLMPSSIAVPIDISSLVIEAYDDHIRRDEHDARRHPGGDGHRRDSRVPQPEQAGRIVPRLPQGLPRGRMHLRPGRVRQGHGERGGGHGEPRPHGRGGMEG